MPIEAADIAALEALLQDQEPLDGPDQQEDPAEEHHLARELGSILANPGSHRIGDLARIVDTLLREMTLFSTGSLSSRDGQT